MHATAGLHFTDRLIESLQERGIRRTAVTLHVGPATFRPVKTLHVEDHRMLPEQVEISAEAAAAIMHTKSGGGRVVAIGTTVVRTLETAADEQASSIPIVAKRRTTSRQVIGFVWWMPY